MKPARVAAALLLAGSAAAQEKPPMVESRLEVLTVATGEREVVHAANAHFEAPDWSRDGGHLLFNQEGRIYRLPLDERTPRVLDTGFATRCNNDHGLSPDGRWLAISHSPERHSLIYVLPATGGTPRLVTAKGPSYWHGWSPDGRTLAYCAERDGEYDVYTIPVEGSQQDFALPSLRLALRTGQGRVGGALRTQLRLLARFR
jgi:TolB protein